MKRLFIILSLLGCTETIHTVGIYPRTTIELSEFRDPGIGLCLTRIYNSTETHKEFILISNGDLIDSGILGSNKYIDNLVRCGLPISFVYAKEELLSTSNNMEVKLDKLNEGRLTLFFIENE